MDPSGPGPPGLNCDVWRSPAFSYQSVLGHCQLFLFPGSPAGPRPIPARNRQRNVFILKHSIDMGSSLQYQTHDGKDEKRYLADTGTGLPQSMSGSTTPATPAPLPILRALESFPRRRCIYHGVPRRHARHCRRAAAHRQLLAAMAGVRRPGDSGQRRLHGPRQLGHRPRRRGAVQVRPALGGGAGQLHGGHSPGHLGPSRRRHRQRPGAMLPRLVSGLDALAELDCYGTRHRCDRPRRVAGQRGGAEPPLPHPAVSGRLSSPRSTCSCCSRCRAWACGCWRRW